MKGHGIWRKYAKEWGFKAGVVALAIIWLALVAAKWAEAKSDRSDGPSLSQLNDANREPASVSDNDDYNFNWLDPDKKIYVLQNRRYTKANRILISTMVGPGFSNSYRNTFNVDPRIAYYLSEAFGIEVFYTITSNSSNNTYQALTNSGTSVIPVIREIRSQYGGLLHWVPWYAKINMFNKILYFDWYFSAGAGNIRTALDTNTSRTGAARFVDQDFFAVFAGTGHQFHLSNTFTVRLDFTGAFYQAPIYGNTGDKTWFPNLNFGIGIGARL